MAGVALVFTLMSAGAIVTGVRTPGYRFPAGCSRCGHGGALRMAVEDGDGASGEMFDMQLLAKRIKEVRDAPSEPATLPLVVLGAILPRQRWTIRIEAPLTLFLEEQIAKGQPCIAVSGADEQSLRLGLGGRASILPRGVEAHIKRYSPRGDGTSDLTLVGTRLFQLEAVGDLNSPHGR
eukprot:scaffold17036_cov119-Isochrysis_galbana.AAC.1